MFCWNCGKEIEDGSKFCMYCGTVLEGGDQPAPKAEDAAPAARPVIEEERDTIWGRGDASDKPAYKKPAAPAAPAGDGGAAPRPARPAAPKGGVQFNKDNLDTILALVGCALLLICTFLPFAGVKGYSEGDVSLMAKATNHVGFIVIVYAALAAAAVYFKQTLVYYAMTICSVVFAIYEASSLGGTEIGYGYSMAYKVGFWFMIIAVVLMVAGAVMMYMNKGKKK